MPKIVDHEARRGEVAAAAQRTIARLGIHNTRLRDIAEEASCSTGVLTHYFPDKEALIRFSLENSLARFGARLARSGATGKGALRATLEQVLPLDKERRTQWTVWLAFWGQAVGSKSLSAEQRRHYREFRAVLEQLVRDGVDGGWLRLGLDPTDEADRILALVEGISFQAVFDPQRWPRERQLSMVDDHLERIVADAAPTRRRVVSASR